MKAKIRKPTYYPFLPKFVNEWIYGKTVSIKVDPWDSWNADTTIAMLAVPVIKQLKKTTHGYHIVDPKDSSIPFDPSTKHEHMENMDAHSELRWNEVLDEIIWALEAVLDDDDWYSMNKVEQDNYLKRRDKGLLLFGKYFTNLWD
jgi:hypothetical protein